MVQIPQFLAEYSSSLPLERSERINALHQFIFQHYPQAQISLKYKMPTYEVGGGWVSIACQKNYVSPTDFVLLQNLHFRHPWRSYTCAREHIQPYIDVHSRVKCGTGCINFRDSDAIAWTDLEPVLQSAFGKNQ